MKSSSSKAENFLALVSIFVPLTEDQTLTAYRNYSKCLEQENRQLQKELKKLKKAISDIDVKTHFNPRTNKPNP